MTDLGIDVVFEQPISRAELKKALAFLTSFEDEDVAVVDTLDQ